MKSGMKMKKPKQLTIMLALLLVLTVGQILSSTEKVGAEVATLRDDGGFQPAESTLPGSPDLLAHEVDEYETYDAEDASYYYKTHVVNASDYCLTWLYQIYDLDNFNLYLYSDSEYNNQVDSSSGGLFEQMEWVIWRTLITQSIYPVVTTPVIIFSYGNARIQTESGERINLSTATSVPLSSTECGELYVVNLTEGKMYKVSLEMPSNCDFDMYVFRIAAGETYLVDYHAITKDVGRNELVKFRAEYSDDYAIVVIWQSGSGTATLTVSPHDAIPAFGICFMILALIGLISISVKNKRIYRFSATN